MFKFFHLCSSIILCYFILLNTAHAQVAKVLGSGEIIIPLPNCGQVRLISKVGVPPNLESLLNSLGYASQLTGAWLGVGFWLPGITGLNAADVWSKSIYSKQPKAYYKQRSSSPVAFKKYYDVMAPRSVRGSPTKILVVAKIIEYFSNPFSNMLNNGYYKAVDKQAWTDNIASQLQGVTTSVDANGDGIIVEQGTCPSVNITLDKPTVTACEAETGSLTVNDPSGQNGMVTLTLPDASTQSFTYTGGAPAPIPFSYAVSEPVGSILNFSATATSNAGKTSNQPATATANVVAGGLNVTVQPAKTVIEPTLNNLRKWMQKAGANKTPITITVNANSQPVSGASISLKTQLGAGNFGGHDHGADPANAKLKPLGITTAVIDNNDGTYTTTYTASMFASEEKVVADVSFRGCTGSATSSVITSKLQNLQKIVLPAGGLHSFVGGTCQHYGADTPWKDYDPTTPNIRDPLPASCQQSDNNHYLTAYRAGLLDRLLKLYEQRWGAGLYINDASLKFGGAFDTNGDWTYMPHSNHRLGLDVDIALKDTSIPLMTLPTSAGMDVVENRLRLAIKELAPEILHEIEIQRHSGNHLHIKPNMNNWRGK